MRKALLRIILVALLNIGLIAQMEIVEIEKPQVAKSVSGLVNDPSGAALTEVIVEERTSDWKTVLRSTETNGHGRFHFSRTGNKTLYHLQFSRSG